MIKKYALIVAAFATLWAIVSYAIGARVFLNPDIFMHSAAGGFMLKNGFILSSDIYSWTAFGADWRNHQWLSQILLHKSLFSGYLLAIVALMYSVTIAILYTSIKKNASHSISIVLVAFFIIVSFCFAQARPHIFAMPLMAIWFAKLNESATSKTSPNLLLALLVPVWVNLYGGFIIAFVSLGAFYLFYLELTVKNASQIKKISTGWLRFLILCFLLSLLNPYGIYAFETFFTITGKGEFTSQVGEWANIKRYPEYAAALIALLVISSTAFTAKKAGIASKAILLASCIIMSVIHFRYLHIAVMLVIIVYAKDMHLFFQKLSLPKFRFSQRALNVAVFGLLLFLAKQSADMSFINPAYNIDLVQAQATIAGKGGNMFNTQTNSGLVISAGEKVFIDTRFEIYPKELLKNYFYLMSSDNLSQENVAKVFNYYQIKRVLLESKGALSRALENDPQWKNLYDKNGVTAWVRD